MDKLISMVLWGIWGLCVLLIFIFRFGMGIRELVFIVFILCLSFMFVVVLYCGENIFVSVLVIGRDLEFWVLMEVLGGRYFLVIMK